MVPAVTRVPFGAYHKNDVMQFKPALLQGYMSDTSN